MLDLDAIEKLLAEGNPAPWIAQVDEDNEQEGSVWCGAYEDERPAVCGSFSNDWPLDAADAETIATLRNAAPTLLALARAGREHYEEHKYCNEDCTCEEFVKEWREADGE